MVVFVVKWVCCPCGILSAVVYCKQEDGEDSSLHRAYTLSFEFSFDSHAYPWITTLSPLLASSLGSRCAVVSSPRPAASTAYIAATLHPSLWRALVIS